MVDKKKNSGFERDGDGNLVCSSQVGQDKKACVELDKKEKIDGFPRDDDGSLECHKLSGDDKTLCIRAKASEMARKSIGAETRSKTE